MGIVDTGMTVIRHMGMTIFLYRFYGNDLCAQALSTFFRAKSVRVRFWVWEVWRTGWTDSKTMQRAMLFWLACCLAHWN